MTLPILYDPADLGFQASPTNAGGIRQLRIIPAQHVSLLEPERFPHPARVGYPDHTVSGQHLTFMTGASFVDVFVYPDYCGFTDVMDTDVNGSFFRPTLQLILPKVSQDVVAWCQKYRDVKWLAFLEDRNGFFRMAGTPENGLSIGLTFGQAMGNGNNQTVLTFTAATTQPAYFVTGITDADLFSTGPFAEAFGFAFNT